MRKVVLVGVLAMLALPASAVATTYAVTTTADPASPSCPSVNNCSLRGAINHSATGDKVIVPAGTYTLTAPTVLSITHDLTITGAGATSTTVNANNAGAVFTVAGINATISGLTITGGKLTGASAQGAGINTSGNLMLSGVTVTGNNVESAAGGSPAGGGIEVAAGNLTLTNSQVTNNMVRCDAVCGAAVPVGAGIDYSNGGLVTLSQSEVTSNVASTGAGNGTPKGGGIHDGSSGTLAISNSQISQDSALTGDGGTPGGGGVAIDGGGVVTITGTTMTADAASTPLSGAPAGGAILNSSGNLAVATTSVSGNISSSSPAGGSIAGGIYSAGPLSLTSSTVSGNTANGGSGGSVFGGGLLIVGAASITNSTITGNSASSSGSGTSSGGGIYRSSPGQTLTVLNSTIDANSAPGGTGGSSGGNIFTLTGAVSDFESSIVSAGSASSGSNCSGTVTSQGHNIESGTDCGFTASGDKQNTDPRLGPLQDNGGPTQTQAVQPLSPIIDAGNTADCPATDQRGVSRPQGPACDIGALEVELPVVSTGAASGITQTAATLNGTVSANTLKPGAGSYHFDWGTTTAYGNSTPTAGGSGAVSSALANLTPNTTYHFRVVATNGDGGAAAGSDQTFTTQATPPALRRPKLTAVGETHRVFAVGAAVTPISKSSPDNRAPVSNAPIAGHHPKGTVFSFTLNQPATVKVKILAQKPGRLVGRKCKPATPQLKHRPPCTRSVPVVTLTRTGIPGLNIVAFTGRLPHKKLSPGRYQSVFTATNTAGTSGPQAIAFMIVKP